MPVLYHGMQAKVLYDFDGVDENGELTIREGQLLTVLNQVSPVLQSERHPVQVQSPLARSPAVCLSVCSCLLQLSSHRSNIITAVRLEARAVLWGGTAEECASRVGHVLGQTVWTRTKCLLQRFSCVVCFRLVVHHFVEFLEFHWGRLHIHVYWEHAEEVATSNLSSIIRTQALTFYLQWRFQRHRSGMGLACSLACEDLLHSCTPMSHI